MTCDCGVNTLGFAIVNIETARMKSFPLQQSCVILFPSDGRGSGVGVSIPMGGMSHSGSEFIARKIEVQESGTCNIQTIFSQVSVQLPKPLV